MRLVNIKLNNYRVHRDLTVEFDPRLTILRGPNEGGKSTLMEAIQRALFMKAATGGKMHSEMRSTHHGGNPEVELGFEISGVRYTVVKHFKGNSGTTTLRQHGGGTWQDSEAEQRLDELLGTDIHAQRANKDRMREPWAHLLVFQGESGKNPTEQFTASHRADLLSRFQQSGGGIVQQSDTDAHVAEAISTRMGETFTSTGREAKGSALGQTREALDSARQLESEAHDNLSRLVDAIDSYEKALVDIEQIGESIKSLEADQQSALDKLEQVRSFKQSIKDQRAALVEVQREHDDLDALDQDIRKLRTRIKLLTDEIAPKEEERKRLEADRTGQRKVLDELDVRCKATTKAAADARARLDLQKAREDRLRLQADGKDLVTAKSKADKWSKERQSARQDFAKLPEIDDEALDELREADRTIRSAEATLKAISAGLEVIQAKIDVQVDGKKISAGEQQLFTEPVEISIGDSATLKLTPGGGTSLQQATDDAVAARGALERELRALSVASIQEAEKTYSERTRLESLIDRLTEKLEDIDGDSLDEAISENAALIAGVEATITRLVPQVDDDDDPTDLKAARTKVREAEKLRAAAEDEENELNAHRQSAVAALAELETQLEVAGEALREALSERDQLSGSLSTQTDRSGEDFERSQRLEKLRGALQAEESKLGGLQSQLDELQPELLTTNQERLDNAISRAKERLVDARSNRDRASGELARSGSIDPRERAATSSAKVARLEADVERIARHASAIKLLDDLFKAEQVRLAQAYTAPLIEKTSEYLKCVFGPDATLQLKLEGAEFHELGLSREKSGPGTFEFEALSGGTREQTAAALRLAVAEILAEAHGGTLPVVFDDAFANSDPDRISAVQTMLYLAASRGLQVIVLTCSPKDYQALGAAEVTVNAKTQSVSAAATLPPPRQAVSSTPDLEAKFIEALEAEGGRSGNQSLRDALGWDEVTYDAAKEALIESGRIKPGRGRGGTVILE